MQTLPCTRSCFVCGESNPLGLRLRFETDGHLVRTQFVLRREHSGFKNVIHGGLVATVLDEIMAWTCAIRTGHFAFCAELTVRFQAPVRPGELVTATGELLDNRRNRIFEARAELRDSAGKALAEATGKYMPISAADTADLMSDMVGDLPDLPWLSVGH
jgi:uncharacterized protein (TIGR00369 family)